MMQTVKCTRSVSMEAGANTTPRSRVTKAISPELSASTPQANAKKSKDNAGHIGVSTSAGHAKVVSATLQMLADRVFN